MIDRHCEHVATEAEYIYLYSGPAARSSTEHGRNTLVNSIYIVLHVHISEYRICTLTLTTPIDLECKSYISLLNLSPGPTVLTQ